MACLAPSPESNPFPLEDAATNEEEGGSAQAYAVVTDDMAAMAIKEIEEEARKAQAFVTDMEVGFSTEEEELKKDQESWEAGTNTIYDNPVNEINYTDALLSGEKVKVDPFKAKPKEKETIGWSDVVRAEVDEDDTAKKQDETKEEADPNDDIDSSEDCEDDISIDDDTDDDDDDDEKEKVSPSKEGGPSNKKGDEPVFYDWAKMRRISRLKGKRSSSSMKRQQSAPNVTAACNKEGIDPEKSAEDYYDWSQQRREELVKTNSLSAIDSCVAAS